MDFAERYSTPLNAVFSRQHKLDLEHRVELALLQALSESTVRFAPLTPALIQAYVDSGEPMGKAGAYAVQGRAAAFIAHISGSYSGIMGLPLFETAQLLRAVGVEA